jgi:hypothetical protein
LIVLPEDEPEGFWAGGGAGAGATFGVREGGGATLPRPPYCGDFTVLGVSAGRWTCPPRDGVDDL